MIGAVIRYIQTMRGRADLATTGVYTRVGVTKRKAVHSDTYPAKRVGTCYGTAEARPPEVALFAALESEADASGEVT